MSEMTDYVDKIAEENGWLVDKDSETYMTVVKGLVRNKKETGQPYCPCKIFKTEENICPCKHMREIGFCRCRLYVRKIQETD